MADFCADWLKPNQVVSVDEIDGGVYEYEENEKTFRVIYNGQIDRAILEVSEYDRYVDNDGIVNMKDFAEFSRRYKK